VHKHRENGRVVAVEQRQVFGTPEDLEDALGASTVSGKVNTSFLERQHATDRGRNARKSRETYRFSKDWQVHEAVTYLTMYSYNFCWCVRTLRVKDEEGHCRASAHFCDDLVDFAALRPPDRSGRPVIVS
jgi:hypothetical protein